MEKIDWDKAPEGATHYVVDSISPFEKRDGDDWFFWSAKSSKWVKLHGIFGDKRLKEGFDIIQRPSPSWSGEGLPPVGVVCEAKCMARGSEREWFKATVNYSSRCAVVLDDGPVGEFVAHPATMKFRPIRTPEQIAADEREAAIKDLISITSDGVTSINMCDAARIYDAGYRKP